MKQNTKRHREGKKSRETTETARQQRHSICGVRSLKGRREVICLLLNEKSHRHEDADIFRDIRDRQGQRQKNLWCTLGRSPSAKTCKKGTTNSGSSSSVPRPRIFCASELMFHSSRLLASPSVVWLVCCRLGISICRGFSPSDPPRSPSTKNCPLP